MGCTPLSMYQKTTLRSTIRKRSPEETKPKLINKTCSAEANGQAYDCKTLGGNSNEYDYDLSDDEDKNMTESGVVIQDKSDDCTIAARYNHIRQVGNGPFGEVVIAREKATGNVRLIKILKKNLMTRRGGGRGRSDLDFIKELELVRSLDHPNIMRLYPLYQDSQNFYVISDLYSGGDLLEYLCRNLKLPEADAAYVFTQVLHGIRYIHSKGIVHRDIKAENVYFDKPFDEWSDNLLHKKATMVSATKPQLKRSGWCKKKERSALIKIVDFGLSCKMEKKPEFSSNWYPLEERIGTSFYVAPEVLKKRYNEKCDVWSAGVLLYIMIFGYPPFYGSNECEIIDKVLKGKFRFYKKSNKSFTLTEEVKRLLESMLRHDASKRISAETALQSDWIRLFNIPINFITVQQVIRNMRAFQKSDKLARLSILFMGRMLTTIEETRHLARAFVALDENGDGRLDGIELYRCFWQYDTDGYFRRRDWERRDVPSREEVIKLRSQFSTKFRSFSVETFTTNSQSHDHLGENETFESIEKARWRIVDSVIESVDFDGNGFIEYSEFVTVALEKEKLITEMSLQAAFNWIDKDGSGTISEDELKKMLPRVTDGEWIAIIEIADANHDNQVDFEEFKKMMVTKCFTEKDRMNANFQKL